MDPTTIETVMGFPFSTVLFGVTLSLARPLGFAFGFIAFYWGLMRTALVRLVISFAIGTPVFVGNLGTFSELVNGGNSRLANIMLLPKEFAIGFAFGLLASLPFFAFRFAGGLADSYRGESNSGTMSPTGGEIQTTSLLFVLIAFLVFFQSDGLFLLAEDFFLSYTVWSLDTFLPQFSPDAATMFMMLVFDMFLLMLKVGLPLLISVAFVDLMLMGGNRLARKFNLQELSFLLKNTIYILILPLIVMGVIRMANGVFPELGALGTMRDLFVP